MAETAIEFKGVSKRFKGNEYDSVSNVNLKIEKGTFCKQFWEHQDQEKQLC